MRDTNLVNALREHAEWAEGNQWETPITLGNDLAEAADRIEAQAKEIENLRRKVPPLDPGDGAATGIQCQSSGNRCVRGRWG